MGKRKKEKGRGDRAFPGDMGARFLGILVRTLSSGNGLLERDVPGGT